MKILTDLQARAYQFKNDEEGATMVEYGLLVTLIALDAAVGATALGGALSGMFNGIAGQL